MDLLIKENGIQELDKKSKENINGGGPILEAIAWLYGYAQGSAENHADMEITNEHRVFLGG